MAYVNVKEWSIGHVLDWMKGSGFLVFLYKIE